MKETYVEPLLNIILLSNESIIATSDGKYDPNGIMNTDGYDWY